MLARLLTAILLASSLWAQQPATPSSQPSPQTSSAHGYVIAGMVVNSLTGQPLPSAAVAISPLAQGVERDVSKSVVTGPDGRFAFTGLAQGKYSLMGKAHGFSLQAFDRHDEYATAIAVGPNLDSQQLVFRLQPDASIEGDVTDENNDPIQYAMVRLFQTNIQGGQQKTIVAGQTQSDDRGHYHLGHLEPGAYYLAVSARPWYAQNVRVPHGPETPNAFSQNSPEDAALDVTYPLVFYPDTTDSADATPLRLAPGERQTANITLRAMPALHVRIHTGASQNGVLGHMVFPRISRRIFDGYLDPVTNAPDAWVGPGIIQISGLSPGHYVVEMSSMDASNDKGAGKGWYREMDLTGDADISASDAPGFVSLSGSMLFENSRVPKYASVQLSNPDTGETFRSDIGEHGEFDFSSDRLRPGRYLLLLGSGNSFYVKKLVATGAKVVGRTIEISAPGTVHVAAIATRGLGQVDGVAVREGEPFAGAMVVLVPQDPANNAPLFRRDQSDSDGTFTLANVVPGQYTVIALANGWDLQWENAGVLEPYMKHGEIITVPADGKLQVKVQLQ